jgi:hypothetical protein
MVSTEDTMIAAIADEVVKQISPRLERIERGLFGDDGIGHIGLVDRLETLEGIARGINEVHNGIDGRRVEGDRRLHERIDVEIIAEMRKGESRLTEETRKLDKKVDRAIWIVVGASLALNGGGIWAAARVAGG